MSEYDPELAARLIEESDRVFMDEEFLRIVGANQATEIDEAIEVNPDVPVVPLTHERLTQMVRLEALEHSARAGKGHGVWIAYGKGRVRKWGRSGMTIMEAHETRRRVFDKLKAMRDRGAIIAATEVGISGGPSEWR